MTKVLYTRNTDKFHNLPFTSEAYAIDDHIYIFTGHQWSMLLSTLTSDLWIFLVLSVKEFLRRNARFSLNGNFVETQHEMIGENMLGKSEN